MSNILTKLALSFPPLFVGVGAFVFDFNETHVRNPRWTPHAKFHNGQTMSMGAALCLTCLYFIWLRYPVHLRTKNAAAAREALVAAWLLGSLYCVTGISAWWYPGSSGVDPEFYEESIGEFPQLYLFGIPMFINGLAFLWELGQLGKLGVKKA